MIGIKLYDPADYYFPNLGLIKVKDPETNQSFWLDTSLENNKNIYNKKLQESELTFEKESKKIAFDMISINVQEDYVKPLMTFFKMRGKRY